MASQMEASPARSARHFGTILSGNSPPRASQNKEKSTTKKGPNSAPNNQRYTVSFEPGPIGIELERGVLPHAGGAPCCRVQRFVDGGPNEPGPARASGLVRPGDQIVAVNGSPVKTYDQTISVLKQSVQKREITFQSAWSDGSGRQSKVPVPGILRKTLRPSSVNFESHPTVDLAYAEEEQTSIHQSNLWGSKSEDDEEQVVFDEGDDSEEESQGTPESKQHDYSEMPLLFSPSFTSIAWASSAALSSGAGNKEHSETTESKRRDSKQTSPAFERRDPLGNSDSVLESISVIPEEQFVLDDSYKESSDSTTTSLDHTTTTSKAEVDRVERPRYQTAATTTTTTAHLDALEFDFANQNAGIATALDERTNGVENLVKSPRDDPTKLENETLKLELSKLRAENDDLREAKTKGSELEQALKEAIQQRGNLDYELKLRKTELKQALAQKNAVEVKLEGSLEQSAKLDDTSRALQETRMKLMISEESRLHSSKEVETLSARLRTETNLRQESELELESAKKDIELSEDRWKYSVQELSSVSEELASEKRHHQELQTIVEELKRQHEFESEQYLDQISSRSEDLEEKKRLLEAATTQLRECDQKMKVLSQALSDEEASKVDRAKEQQNLSESLAREVRLNEETTRRLHSKLEELDLLRQSHEEELSAERDSHQKTSELLTRAESDLQSSKDAMEDETSEKVKAKGELETLRNKFIQSDEIAQQEAKSLREALERQEVRIQLLQAEKDKSIELNETMKEKIRELEQDKEAAYEEVRNLQQQVEDANTQGLIAQIDDLSHQRDTALDHVATLSDDLKRTEEALHETQSRSKDLEDKLVQRSVLLQTELTEKDSRVLATQDELDDLHEQLRRKKEELDLSQNSLKTSRQQCDDMNARLSRLAEHAKRKEATFSEELIKSQDAASKFSRKNAELEKILRSMRRTLASSEERATAAREKLSGERKMAVASRKREEEERAKMRRRIESMLQQEHEANSTKQSLERQCDDLHQQVNSMVNRNKELENALADMTASFKAKIKNLTTSLSDQRETNRESRVTIDRIQRDYDNLLRRFEEESQVAKFDAGLRLKQHEDLNKDKENITKELLQTKEERRLVLMNLKKSNDSLSKANKDYEALSEAFSEYKSASDGKIKAMMETNANESKQMTRERDDLKNSLREMETSKEEVVLELNKTKEDFSQVVSRLEDENYDLSRKLVANADAVDRLQSTLEELKAEYVDCSLTDDGLTSFFGLPRAELRAMCHDFRDQLTHTEDQLVATQAELTSRQKRIAGLESELTNMSTEMARSAQAHAMLENRIREMETKHDSAQSLVASLRSSLESYMGATKTLEKELASEVSQKESLGTRLESVQSDYEASLKRASQAIADLEQAKDKIEQAERNLAASEAERATQSETLRRNDIVAEEREQRLVEAVKELKSKTLETDRVRKQAQSIEGKLDQTVAECSKLKMGKAEVEVERDALKQELMASRERERLLIGSRDQLEKKEEELEKTREDTVSKLADATLLVLSQKQEIDKLDAGRVGLEESCSKLECQVSDLQGKLRKMEARAAAAGENTLAHSQQCAELKREHNDIRNQLDREIRLREESQRAVGSLTRRVDQLKSSLTTANEEVRSFREIREDLEAELKDRKLDDEAKQMEIAHLKARAQVSNATIARLKSDCLLATSQKTPESPMITGESELSRLKSQVQTQDTKLQSLHEALLSQREVLSLTQSLEHQLLKFVDGVLQSASGTLEDLMHHVDLLDGSIHSSVGGRRFRYLDLANVEVSDHSQEIEQFLSHIVRLLPKERQYLNEKARELNDWKERRAIRVVEGRYSTPQKSRALSPSATEALNSMKELLSDELSPRKEGAQSVSMNPEYLQDIIHSLEGQIDLLLLDLRAANDALRAKDAVFADLEELLSHTEAENEELHKRLKATTVGVNSPQRSGEEDKLNIELASHMMERFCEERELKKVGTAFRHWACSASSSAAVEKQDGTAAKLASELHTTKEKVLLLKEHLKKSRRVRSSAKQSEALE